MPVCKHCAREFHHCSSCDYDEYADAGFCSQLCYELSGTGKSVYDLIKLVVDGIPDELFPAFCNLMLDDDNEGRGGMDSVPDGEWFFNEYALRRKMGAKEFCKMKLDQALAEIERKRKREEQKRFNTHTIVMGSNEREIYEKLKVKFEGCE